MRIAIIGATGNVGTALLRRLQAAGVERGAPLEIVGVARRLPGSTETAYQDVAWQAIDISSPTSRPELTAALEGCDAVVHLAWLLQPNHEEPVMRATNVDGTANVLAAAVEAGVPHVVCASSVGAYSPGPKDRRVDEGHPARGIRSSHYSRFKGEQEALLDAFESDHPGVRVARLRPGLIFQPDAGSEIGRYFLGAAIPQFFLHRLRLPLLPFPREFVFQAVHADDIADAYWRVVDQQAGGAFNVAAEPVITPNVVGWLLGARRWMPVPVSLVRAVVAALWSARLLATDPGWVDMAQGAPVMDTRRARAELGWKPRVDSLAAIRGVLEGLGQGAGVPASPPLVPRHRSSTPSPL
ncbi:MAG TPA: NAD-dependent epimerase/dehydratase family protein [Arthrobacter sp.]|nr:NAD-dependent epimerase/dehydratase family protein [Arthrobacter sp.]